MIVPINDTLQLTAFERSDASNLLRYMNDPVLYANTSRVPHPYTEQDADNWLTITEKELDTFGFPINWAIRHVEHGVIGGIGCFLKAGMDGHLDEMGYWLASPFRGNGIMTNVVRHYCSYLFEARPTLVRLEARVFPHNPASARVLEKAGFEREGYAKKLVLKNGQYIDNVLFAQIKG